MRSSKSRSFVDKIKGHRAPIIGLFSPNGCNGQRLYSASSDGWLYVWDILNKEILHKVQLEVQKNGPVLSLTCIELNENIVYGGLTTGEIYSWNIKSGEIVGNYCGHTNKIIALSKIDERVLVSVECGGKELRLWDTISSTLQATLSVSRTITSMVCAGKQIFIIAERHFLYVFDAEQRNLCCDQKLPQERYYLNALTTQNSLFLHTDDWNLEVHELPYRNGSRPKIIKVGAWVNVVKVRPLMNFGNQLLLGCSDGSIRYLELKQQKGTIEPAYCEVDRVESHDGSVNCLEYCSGLLFTGSSDYNIKSWNVEELYRQHMERQRMHNEQLESRKHQVYLKCLKKKKRRHVRR